MLQYVDARIDKVKAEMTVELKSLEATFKAAEVQRSVDYQGLLQSINDVKGTLPTVATVRNYVLGGFGAVVAALALFWAVFDTGAGMIGSVADHLIDAKENSRSLEKQNELLLNRLDAALNQSAEPAPGNTQQDR